MIWQETKLLQAKRDDGEFVALWRVIMPHSYRTVYSIGTDTCPNWEAQSFNSLATAITTYLEETDRFASAA